MNRYQILRGEVDKETAEEALAIDYTKINYFIPGNNIPYRIGILSNSPNSHLGGIFISRALHFDERRSGKFILCNEGPCCAELGRSFWRAGCYIIKYNVDLSGALIDNSYKILFWRSTLRVHNQLGELNHTFPITFHDLLLTQTFDGQSSFAKNTTIQIMQDSWWRDNPVYQSIADNIQYYDPNKYGLAKLATGYNKQ